MNEEEGREPFEKGSSSLAGRSLGKGLRAPLSKTFRAMQAKRPHRSILVADLCVANERLAGIAAVLRRKACHAEEHSDEASLSAPGLRRFGEMMSSAASSDAMPISGQPMLSAPRDSSLRSE